MNNKIIQLNSSCSVCQINGKTYINGEEIENVKSMFFKNSIATVNNKTYINGKELKNGKWKYTIKSIFHTIF